MEIIKDNDTLITEKSESTFKPYSELISINTAKSKIRLNNVLKKPFDTFMYWSDIIYLDMKKKLKRYSETIWSIIIVLYVSYLIIWLIKNI